MSQLVSIITPLYNSEAFIIQTIHSVLQQSYTNWELVLIDDCSTDNTITIVNNFIAGNNQIKLIKNKENKGAAVSRNKGVMAAKGDYIAFLDADDLWKPKKLEKQIAFMQDQGCEVCFCSYEQINEKGKPLNKLIKALPVLTYKKYLKSNYIGNLTGIYNAKKRGKIKAPNLRKRQDWLLWLKAIELSGKPPKRLEESLALYRVRDNSISSNKLELLKHNYWVYKRGLSFSTPKSIYYMLIFLYEHFFIKSKQTITLRKK